MLNKIILSLGSNQDQEKNMAEAVRILRNQFVSFESGGRCLYIRTAG